MDGSERVFSGIPVSPGIGIGRVYLLDRRGSVAAEPVSIDAGDVDEEIARFKGAVAFSREQLGKIRQHVAEAIDEQHADIFLAQATFLDDPMLIDHTIEAIRSRQLNAEYLFNARVQEFMAILSMTEDETFKARNSDLLDIADRVTANLSRRAIEENGATRYPDGSVLVGVDLSPSEATALTGGQVIGFVLEKGGPTSHTAIMAKALEIPAVVAAAGVSFAAPHGALIIIDGIDGKVVVRPSAETLEHYEKRRAHFIEQEHELLRLRDEPAETVDGYLIELCGNVELPEEIKHLSAHGARGIGLFRTEFIFMNQSAVPTEEQQFAIYKRVVEEAAPHTVVFRTLDFGGDKFPAAGMHSHELNPFMGQRAIRLCLSRPEIFREQLRAMLRASAFGSAKILVPMISGVEEFLEAKGHVRHVKAQLKKEGIKFDPQIPVGAMIEVPSAAVVAEDLARVCDFFSIGTNDLIQYTLAVDRGNERVAYLYDPLHPAILKLLRQVVQAARRGGIPVTVCGEVAADPMMAVLLVGMGIDELSMSAVSIPHVKKLVRSISLSEAKLLVDEIMKEPKIDGIKRIIRRQLRAYIKQNKTAAAHLLRERHTAEIAP